MSISIANILLDSANFKVHTDGQITISVRVANDGNFLEAINGSTKITLPLKNLESFLAGLSISSVGISGSCEEEVTVKVLRQNGKYEVLNLDNYLPELHQSYVFWTHDNNYDDPELTKLQKRMAIRNIPAQDISAGQRFGMCVDEYCTVFADNLPQPFIDGLILFQKQSNSCYTHIILTVDAPDSQKIGSTWSNNEDSQSD